MPALQAPWLLWTTRQRSAQHSHLAGDAMLCLICHAVPAVPAGVALGKCIEYGFTFADQVAAQLQKAAAKTA